jgi:hypothetical protein
MSAQKDPVDAMDRWYQCDISREEIKELMQRSDLKGAIHTVSFFAVLIGLGILAYHAIGTPWMIPAFFAYGTVYCFLNHLMHETHHRTVFKSVWINVPDAINMPVDEVMEFTHNHAQYAVYRLNDGFYAIRNGSVGNSSVKRGSMEIRFFDRRIKGSEAATSKSIRRRAQIFAEGREESTRGWEKTKPEEAGRVEQRAGREI